MSAIEKQRKNHNNNNIITKNLVTYLDEDNPRSFAGEPTVNVIGNLIDVIGGEVSYSNSPSKYKIVTLETNVKTTTAPVDNYTHYNSSGTNDGNAQAYWTAYNVVDGRNKTFTFSVWLRGSGTCHLTIYDDSDGYKSSPIITLTDNWTRYTHTRTVGNYTSSFWGAVRGIINTTDVYVSGVQMEEKTHATTFTKTERPYVGGLSDLVNTNDGDLTNTAFDGNSKIIYDGTSSYTSLGSPPSLKITNNFSISFWMKTISNPSSGYAYILSFTQLDSYLYGWRFENGDSGNLYYALGNGSGIESAEIVGAVDMSNYQNITLVTNTPQNRIYLYNNGNLIHNKSLNGHLLDYTNCDIKIGYGNPSNRQYYNGNVPVVMVYNKTLSPTEVKINFEAMRDRFNI